jgi:hypothetical protein
LARYVFGDELKLKPGKRWKRRLLDAATAALPIGARTGKFPLEL